MVVNFLSLFFFVVSLILFSESISYAAGDIFCNHNNKRYDTPNQCVPECKVRMKNPMGGCFLSPQCESLPNEQTFKQLYNQAIFLRGPLPRPYSYLPLVNYIINRIIDSPDVTLKDLTIYVGKYGCKFYAEASSVPTYVDGRKTYPLRINEKAFFELSPPYLVLTISHEILHVSQFKRGIHDFDFKAQGAELARLWRLVQAFTELEVSYYETQSPLVNCLTQKEKEEVKWRKDYWEWKAKEAIEGVSGISKLLKQAEEWLKSNIWTWGNWLPKNPEWKTYRPDWNNKPDDPVECPGK